MKKLIFALLVLTAFLFCANHEIGFSQTRSNANIISNATIKTNDPNERSGFSFEKLIAAQQTTNKTLKWSAPLYAGLRLGKARQADVIKTFGEPDSQSHPFSEYESTKNEWTFYYENINDFDGRINFTFDIRSKILEEVWLRPNDEKPLTIEQAIGIYGEDYFLRSVGKNICSSKKLTKLEYPFTIVYPRKGIFLWVRDGNQVDDIIYVAKCP